MKEQPAALVSPAGSVATILTPARLSRTVNRSILLDSAR